MFNYLLKKFSLFIYKFIINYFYSKFNKLY